MNGNYVNKILEYIKSKRKKKLRKIHMIRRLKTRSFKYKYTLINLCISYAAKGLKQGRFIYRVKKTVKLLMRNEELLNKVKRK